MYIYKHAFDPSHDVAKYGSNGHFVHLNPGLKSHLVPALGQSRDKQFACETTKYT